MTSGEFKKLRKFLKLSQKEMAEALGLKRRMIQYYEKGERDGEPLDIPKAVELACYALAAGVREFTFVGPKRASRKTTGLTV
ncbi:helix-turn-helix transcriptional regulator [Nisaea sp.]|uniref:helix-turn-helix transcriptional regulator n=1 Tax=Nisaea sp. TaxID=2024842 RepID=UPI003B5285C0